MNDEALFIGAIVVLYIAVEFWCFLKAGGKR